MSINQDYTHVLRMILNENKGNVLTEALCFGIEHSFVHYVEAITFQQNSNSVGESDGAQ